MSLIFIRYGIVAGLAYAVDFCGFIFLLNIGCSPFLANIIVKIIAAIFGFYGHRYFTYLIRNRKGILEDAIRYFGLVLFYTPTSTIFLYCIMLLIKNPIYSKAISDGSLFFLMFWITSKFTFKKNKV